MKSHEFHRLYANMPLHKRLQPLNIAKHGDKTLSDFYHKITELEDAIRSLNRELDGLLEDVEPYLKNNILTLPTAKIKSGSIKLNSVINITVKGKIGKYKLNRIDRKKGMFYLNSV